MGRRQLPAQFDLMRVATQRLLAGPPPQDQVRVVLWLPADDRKAAGKTCLDWCAVHGYAVVGVVVDDGDPARWLDAVAMVAVARKADVILAADLADFPRDRVPRTEAVAQTARLASKPPPDAATPLRRRRPRRLK